MVKIVKMNHQNQDHQEQIQMVNQDHQEQIQIMKNKNKNTMK